MGLGGPDLSSFPVGRQLLGVTWREEEAVGDPSGDRILGLHVVGRIAGQIEEAPDRVGDRRESRVLDDVLDRLTVDDDAAAVLE
ncbi:hypothetical protein GCM10009676_43900 [Prauserella halophila]|uniref:Uncharacterized protein n=1 Tax=Prauserella halophila TaxID=185641 RepID=A0ABN1WKH1_9PSEU